MKKLILTIAAGIVAIGCFAQVNVNYTHVNGYTLKNGTYVEGYNRTSANYTNRDNYTTKPNTNPWTGKNGYVQPDNYYYKSTKSNSSYTYPSYSTGRRKK